jgi:hypothetical protein
MNSKTKNNNLKIDFTTKYFCKTHIEEETGIRCVISQSLAYFIIKYYEYDINDIIEKIEIEDFYINSSLVDLDFSEISFGIKNFSSEHVKFIFNPPYFINIKITNLEGWGKFKCKFKNKLISGQCHAVFDMSDFYVTFSIKIGTKQLKNGRLIFDSELLNYNVKYDYDFILIGDYEKMISMFKPIIKKNINNAINDTVKFQLNRCLQYCLSLIPNEIELDNIKGTKIDFSLINNPIIENNFIIINSYAQYFSKNIKETQNKNHYFLTLGIPSHNLLGKPHQIFISEYVLNVALFTFYKLNDLKYKLTPEIMPQNIPLIKLNTGWLGIFFKDFGVKYGMEKNVEITFKIDKDPQVCINKNGLYFILPTLINVDVRNVDLSVVVLNTNFYVNASLIVVDDYITGKIDKIEIGYTNIIYSYSDFENFGSNFEKNLNNIKGICLPFLNNFIKLNMQYPIPKIDNVKICDISIEYYEQFISVNFDVDLIK